MDLSELQRLWDRHGAEDPLWAIKTDADKRGQRWRAEEFFATGVAEIEAAAADVEKYGLSMRGDALDFGCGVGRLSQAMATRCDTVTGVDIAPTMIAEAERLNPYGDRVRYRVNGRPDLSMFENESFDFVYSNIVLQHMAPRYSEAYIREFVRVLRVDGVALFQVPSHPAWTLIGLGLWVLPVALVRLVRKMDMYGIRRERVQRLVKEAGGELVDAAVDHSAGPHWVSYRYCVRKRSR